MKKMKPNQFICNCHKAGIASLYKAGYRNERLKNTSNEVPEV